jgi:hypothetical protein
MYACWLNHVHGQKRAVYATAWCFLHEEHEVLTTCMPVGLITFTDRKELSIQLCPHRTVSLQSSNDFRIQPVATDEINLAFDQSIHTTFDWSIQSIVIVYFLNVSS